MPHTFIESIDTPYWFYILDGIETDKEKLIALFLSDPPIKNPSLVFYNNKDLLFILTLILIVSVESPSLNS
jgi:hypothetical protein